MKLLLAIVIYLYVIVDSYAQITENIFGEHTSIEKPFDMRDPFKIPKSKSEISKRIKDQKRAVLDNIAKVDFPFDIKKTKLVGVLIGKERRVILKMDGKQSTYTLQEGDTFGKDGPEIKAILPGGIILVEKINNIYGESEYIETVVPISE